MITKYPTKSFFEVTSKARARYNIELHYSKLFGIGYSLTIFGGALIISGAWEAYSGLIFALGIVMYCIAKIRTAKKKIF